MARPGTAIKKTIASAITIVRIKDPLSDVSFVEEPPEYVMTEDSLYPKGHEQLFSSPEAGLECQGESVASLSNTRQA